MTDKLNPFIVYDRRSTQTTVAFKVGLNTGAQSQHGQFERAARTWSPSRAARPFASVGLLDRNLRFALSYELVFSDCSRRFANQASASASCSKYCANLRSSAQIFGDDCCVARQRACRANTYNRSNRTMPTSER